MRERTVMGAVLGIGLAIPILAAASALAHVFPSSCALAYACGALLAAFALTFGLAQRRRFPPSLDGAARRRPIRASLWSLLATLSLLLFARLGVFMSDPSQTWGSLVPVPDVVDHMCMTAYVYAADLSRQGEPNVYDERHWPAFHTNDAAAPSTRSSVAELDPWISDPYEYPPQFLLLPRLGLLATNHFLVLRAVWFALEATLLLAVALSLARWIGGHAGLVVGLLSPALVASVPALFNLQFGQAHLLVFAFSLGALVAFERGRPALGGALLGTATVIKLFPALIILYLAMRRRWRDLAWTIGAMIALTALTFAVVGGAPFVAFARYQLPRIASGAAFSFFLDSLQTISSNFSVPGLVFKLGALGASSPTFRDASVLGWIYTLLLLALVVHAARRRVGDRLAEASIWLGLLNLGSLRSPLAPSGYVTLGALWLLTLFAARARRPREVALIVVAWIVIPGGPPLSSAPWDIALRFIGQLAMIALSVYGVWHFPEEPLSARGSPSAERARINQDADEQVARHV